MDWHFYNICFSFTILNAISVSSATKCTRACRLKEKGLDCWAQSLDFYTASMYEAVDQYAATLLYLARWQHEHNDSLPGQVNILRNLSQSRTLKEYLPDPDGARPLEREDFEAIMGLIQQRVTHLEHLYIGEEKLLPHFVCPIPCGYNSQVWYYVSILLFVILVLSCLAFYLFYRQQFLSRPAGHQLLLKER